MKPNDIRKSFLNVLADTEKNIDQFVNRPGSDMIRHRSCSFKDTVLSVLSFSMNRLDTEMLNYFCTKSPGSKADDIGPSPSAFIQQRHKFNSKLFPHLLSAFNQAIPFQETFKGHHIVAVDGTDLDLPTHKSDSVYCVKQARSDDVYYQMHINALFDIQENRYVSLLTQPRPQMNESAAFLQMISESGLPSNTIFLADRGYISVNTIASLIASNRLFLIRAKTPEPSNAFLKGLVPEDAEADRWVTISASRSEKAARSIQSDKFIKARTDRPFDLIPLNDHETVWAGSIRCTSIKLDDGNYEFLVSNLPSEAFSPADLKDLYWLRWGIETSFRSLKYALSLSYLHSVSRDLIIQEVFAKAVLYNFVSLIHADVEQSEEMEAIAKRRKRKYKVSFDNAVAASVLYLKRKMSALKLKCWLLRNLTMVKEGRSYPRKVRSQTVRPLSSRA